MTRIPLPNYTQTPNYIIDHWMQKLTHAEFKFIMLVVRYTCGYHRRSAKISYSHFKERCGIDRGTAIRISKKFEEMGWIHIYHGDHQTTNEYEILLSDEEDSKKDNLVASCNQASGIMQPPLVASCHHNKERDINKEKNNNPLPLPDPIPSKPPSDVVVCPFLHRLILTDEHKIRLSKQYDWETLRIAVDRVLAWEGRQSDAAAIETILKRPNEWQDKPDKQAAKAEAEQLLDVIRPYDGTSINGTLIVVGKDYVEFSGGVSYYEVFKAEDPNFPKLLGLKLEKLGLPKKS